MTIIFLFEPPVTRRDWQRFGMGELIERGVHVRALDMSAFLSSRPDHVEFAPPAARVECRTLFAALRELARSDPATTWCCVHFPITWKTLPLLWMLRLRRLRFSVTMTNTIPNSLAPVRRQWRLPTLAGVVNRLIRKVRPGLPRATARFLGGTRSLHANLEALGPLLGPATLDVWSQHLDCDTFDESAGVEIPEKGEYILFLDEYLPYHWEFAARGLRCPETPESYEKRMNRLFAELEQRLGVPVVVAAHPIADYAKLGNPFEGRRIHQHQTPALVRHARLVVAHASTALSFVVLADRPLLLCATHALLQAPVTGSSIQGVAGELEKRVLNVDEPFPADLTPFLEHEPTAYARYADRFLRRAGTLPGPYWARLLETASGRAQDAPKNSTKDAAA